MSLCWYYCTILMSYVPIVATRNPKGLYGHSHIRHVSPAPLVVGKGPNRVQHAHLKAIDVADPVVHVHPRAVLEPVIQTRPRGLRQGNQKGSLFLKRFLSNEGFFEVINFSFINSKIAMRSPFTSILEALPIPY